MIEGLRPFLSDKEILLLQEAFDKVEVLVNDDMLMAEEVINKELPIEQQLIMARSLCKMFSRNFRMWQCVYDKHKELFAKAQQLGY